MCGNICELVFGSRLGTLSQQPPGFTWVATTMEIIPMKETNGSIEPDVESEAATKGSAVVPDSRLLQSKKSHSHALLHLQRSIASVGIARQLPLQSLGPFKGVPIEFVTLGVETINIMELQGGAYSINLDSPCLREVVKPHFEETGRLSPSSEISLTGTQRTAAGIPEGATHYAFAYPLPGFCDAGSVPLSDYRFCFLALGGFIYWGHGGYILGVNALTMGEGLYFEGPYALKSTTLRSYLYDAGRVEEATAEALVQCHITGERRSSQLDARTHLPHLGLPTPVTFLIRPASSSGQLPTPATFLLRSASYSDQLPTPISFLIRPPS